MKPRANIRQRQLSLGTFVKTDSPQITEVLGTTDLDFVVVDAEHAPFDRLTLDRHMMAGRAAGIPVIVRIPDTSPSTIQSVLDLGAAGLLVPRVDNAEQAREVVARARYRNGSRGFSISPRSAGYGTHRMADAIEAGDQTLVICQIESADGVTEALDIAHTPGVDGLFIGRADLALSMGLDDIRAPAVSRACGRIIEAAKAAGVSAAMFVPNEAEALAFREIGVDCFVVSSDQSLLRQAAQQFAAATTALRKSASGR